MLRLQKAKSIKAWRLSFASGVKVGFVPTMGALHEGHISLIRESQKKSDLTVCSIFVNPTQFDRKMDLEKYPRDIRKDAALLRKEEVDLLFEPTVNEIYPEGTEKLRTYDLGGLDEKLEGAHRPGHFQGVCQVVHRLLELVQPNLLFMGQKDFQQMAVIQKLIGQIDIKPELIACPTEREADGLAMSSRNVRLTDEYRKRAPAIYQALLHAKKNFGIKPVGEIVAEALDMLEEARLKPEYFEIVDGNELEPVRSATDADHIVALTAAWAGEVRLIDNVILREKGQ
ncbi:MAG: pantoate--beta-alanine ligase [Saprospiraceae bacterium]|nr:pantoate--beta-alanine ligase [Saprospiraceae bacterium]